MMKNIYIGDIHGRITWMKIVEEHLDADNVVFIGDYFDSYDDISAADQIDNLLKIIEYKKTSKSTVTLLIGNHDHHYWPSIGNTGTSGYQSAAAPAITKVFEDNKEHFNMAVLVGDKLCTHAGVSPIYLEDNGWKESDDIITFLNDLFEFKPRVFIFAGRDPYGDDFYQTPIWIRPPSLRWVNNDVTLIRDKYVQIVGHTQQNTINVSSCGRYVFIDTLPVGEYLIEIDGELSVGNI
jgi:hypothetical protein